MSVDITVPLRTAVLANAGITALLPAYLGSYPVFTRRPVPADAPFPLILISPDVAVADVDGINDFRPTIVRDIIAYSRNDVGVSYRDAFAISQLVKAMFHRQRLSFTPPSPWTVTQIVASGPQSIPEDDQVTARIVTLTIELARRGS